MSWKRTLSYNELLEHLQFRFAAKVGIASTVSLFLGVGFSQILDRPDSLVSGLWTVVTAIVVVQAYLGGTYLAAWVRFLGTFVGSIIGCLCTIALGSNAISLGFSVFLTIIVCSALNIKDSVRIASISVAFVLVLWGLKPEISPWTFAFFRFMDSCLGILIAVIVVHTLWPTQATKQLRLNIAIILRNLKEYYVVATDLTSYAVSNQHSSELILRETIELMRESRLILEESRIEILTHSSLQDWIFLIEHLEETCELVSNIHNVKKYHLKNILSDSLAVATDECIYKIELAFDELATTMQERHSVGQPIPLLGSLENLIEELKVFREMQVTTQLPIQDAESFFVFFYGLKALAQEVIKIDNKIHSIYK